MTAGSAASRRVLARTPVAPLPASSPTRPVGITGRTSAPPDSSLPEVCSFQLPKVCSFRLPLTSEKRWQSDHKSVTPCHSDGIGPAARSRRGVTSGSGVRYEWRFDAGLASLEPTRFSRRPKSWRAAGWLNLITTRRLANGISRCLRKCNRATVESALAGPPDVGSFGGPDLLPIRVQRRVVVTTTWAIDPLRKCRGWGSNPHGDCSPQNFKSCASASFATSAYVATLCNQLLTRFGRLPELAPGRESVPKVCSKLPKRPSPSTRSASSTIS